MNFSFDIDMFLDIITVRQGGLLSGMSLVAYLDVDIDEEERLMGIIEERLVAAAASLE